MRKLSVIAALIAVLLLSACGNQGTVNISATGEWAGTITDPDTSYSAPMTMTLDDIGGDLIGSAVIAGIAAGDITGVRNGREATMTVTGEYLVGPVSLEGRFSANSFTGTWLAPGSTPGNVSLQRR